MENRPLKQYLEAGEFVATHGVAGELRLNPWCDEPAFLAGLHTLYADRAGQKKLAGVRIRPHKSVCVVRIPGVDSVEAARPYIGRTAYLFRGDVQLAPGRYFVQDLLGARVVDAVTGEDYGAIAGVTRPGRHDIYEIERPGGGTVLFPAVPAFVESTDPGLGVVTVRPISGMFNGGTGAGGERTAPDDDTD